MQSELLQIARELATRKGGSPHWVSRNRAISAAYYALFHALAELCARELVGAWKPWPAFRHVYRSLDHAAARRTFEAARSRGGFSAGLIAIGDLFRLLQKERHAADYDPGYRVSRAEVLDRIERTVDVLQRLGELPLDERKLLAARLIGRTRS